MLQQHRHLTPSEWDAIAAAPDFKALAAAKKRFIIPATVVFVVFYFALPLGIGLAPHLLSRPVLGPLTLAYVFALAEFVMAWTLLALYLRRARSFDTAAMQIVERARKEHTN